jgi:hypothetical protein
MLQKGARCFGDKHLYVIEEEEFSGFIHTDRFMLKERLLQSTKHGKQQQSSIPWWKHQSFTKR